MHMVTPNGGKLHLYEFREDVTTPAFVSAGRVSQNYNGDLCVGNHDEMKSDSWCGNL